MPRRPPGTGPRSALLLLGVTLVAAGSASGQEGSAHRGSCPSPAFVRVESLQSPAAGLRTLPSPVAETPTPSRTWTTAHRLEATPVCGAHPWLRGWTAPPAETAPSRLLPLTLRLTGNSAWAVQDLDGLQWAGRGVSGVVRGGFELRRGRLTLAVRPVVAFAENRDFAVYDTTLVDRKPFAYPWHARRIDWPQRPGDGSVVWLGPGESRLSVEAGPMEIALSSEQLRWGPSLAYPLLLGPGAPGFPHLRIGTFRPLRLGTAAELDAQVLWGLLDESDQFDLDEDNDRRVLGGLVLSLRPSVLPGFTVGVASLVHSAARDFGAGDLFSFLQVPVEEAGGNVEGNGLGSLFAHWAPPGSGFEAWVEWARDDYSLGFDDLVAEPDHAQAYTAGFQQVGRVGSGLVRLAGELTHLGNDELRVEGGRPFAVFYTHAGLPQGHTHRGQLLGAPVGPGSDAQRLSLDMLREGRLWGGWLERIRWDEDAYERAKAPVYGHDGHDLSLVAGLRHARPLGDLRMEVEGDVRFRRNRLFLDLVGDDPALDWETNLRLQATLTWIPRTRP